MAKIKLGIISQDVKLTAIKELPGGGASIKFESDMGGGTIEIGADERRKIGSPQK